MAIAYDSSANGGSTSTSSLTFSHTCTGSNLVLTVFIKIFNTSNVLTGVTYGAGNGVAMTAASSGQDADSRWSYVYTLINPATGANNVNITTSSATYVGGTSQSYTGCRQTSQPDVVGTPLNTASTTVDTTLTTITDNSWLIGSYNGGRAYTAGSGTTSRQFNGSPDQLYSFDSGGAKTTKGSYSLLGTQSSGANSRNYIISLAPVAAATSHIKSADGILYANIKSMSGVAIASVKSASGVANS